jgi:hypothetical protein
MKKGMLRHLASSALGAAIIWLPTSPVAGTPTTAQQLRSEISPQDLKALRKNMAEMKSPNRWPAAQQDRYRKICLKQKAEESSLNARTCGCYLEIMMNRYGTFGDYAKDLVETGAPADQKTKVLFGACLAAFGD